MFTFMIFLIPLVLLFSSIHSREKISILISCAGALTGIVFCILCAFFSFKHRLPAFNLASNIIYYTLFEYVLPLLVIYLIFFFSTKDPYESRIKSFFPLMMGFYAIYMPYCIIASSYSAFSFFEIFTKPVLFLSMIVLSSACVLGIGKAACGKNVKKIVIFSVICALMLFIPPFINGLYILNAAELFVHIVSIIYAVFAVIVFFIQVRNQEGFLF